MSCCVLCLGMDVSQEYAKTVHVFVAVLKKRLEEESHVEKKPLLFRCSLLVLALSPGFGKLFLPCLRGLLGLLANH